MKRDIKKWWKGFVDILMTDHTKALSAAAAAATGTLSPAAATGALSVAERSYPTSEVRGRSPEFQAVTAQEWRRGATQVRGQGWRPGGAIPHPRSGAAAERRYPANEVRGDSWQELPHAPIPEASGGGQEDQPHVQEAVAAWAQEGLEELSHIEGQEGQQ